MQYSVQVEMGKVIVGSGDGGGGGGGPVKQADSCRVEGAAWGWGPSKELAGKHGHILAMKHGSWEMGAGSSMEFSSSMNHPRTCQVTQW